MGNRKSGMLEKIKEGQEVGNEAKDRAEETKGEGSEVRRLLDSMNRDIDEDDISAIDAAESGYKGDFDVAFSSEVDTKAADSVRIEKVVDESANMERNKVEGIRAKFEQLEGTSDIGQKNADTGRMSMEQSAREYESFSEQAEEVEQDVNESINNLRKQLDGIFG